MSFSIVEALATLDRETIKITSQRDLALFKAHEDRIIQALKSRDYYDLFIDCSTPPQVLAIASEVMGRTLSAPCYVTTLHCPSETSSASDLSLVSLTERPHWQKDISPYRRDLLESFFLGPMKIAEYLASKGAQTGLTRNIIAEDRGTPLEPFEFFELMNWHLTVVPSFSGTFTLGTFVVFHYQEFHPRHPGAIHEDSSPPSQIRYVSTFEGISSDAARAAQLIQRMSELR